MKTVRDIMIPIGGGPCSVMAPVGARIVGLDPNPPGNPVLWVLGDFDGPHGSLHLLVTNRFSSVPDDVGPYIGRYPFSGIVYHVFEVIR